MRDDHLEPIAHALAVTLHRCSAFLPLFLSDRGEEGRKLKRALAVNAQVEEALRNYCEWAGIRRQDLNEEAGV